MANIEPFSGSELFRATSERLFAVLTDPDAIAMAIPDRVSHTRVDDRTLKCVVRPGFSFLRANMSVTLAITAAPPGEITLDIGSKGIGASMDVQCRLAVAGEGEGARVTWEARVQRLGGLLSAVSPTLIRSAADRVIRDGWASLRAQVEAS